MLRRTNSFLFISPSLLPLRFSERRFGNRRGGKTQSNADGDAAAASSSASVSASAPAAPAKARNGSKKVITPKLKVNAGITGEEKPKRRWGDEDPDDGSLSEA